MSSQFNSWILCRGRRSRSDPLLSLLDICYGICGRGWWWLPQFTRFGVGHTCILRNRKEGRKPISGSGWNAGGRVGWRMRHDFIVLLCSRGFFTSDSSYSNEHDLWDVHKYMNILSCFLYCIYIDTFFEFNKSSFAKIVRFDEFDTVAFLAWFLGEILKSEKMTICLREVSECTKLRNKQNCCTVLCKSAK